MKKKMFEKKIRFKSRDKEVVIITKLNHFSVTIIW